MPRFRLYAAVLLVGVAGSVPAYAQVVKDREPLHLEYRILLDDEAAPIGTTEISFETIETKRGPRLQVESMTDYAIPRDPPLIYHEEASLTCDELGPITFETVAQAQGLERKNTALRRDDDYHVTTTFDGKTSTKTITAGVTRTNFGLFCGGVLAERLSEGPILADFPLLYPVGGDHQARQKFREATLPLEIVAERSVRVIVHALRRPNKTTDRIWNTADENEILVRLRENSAFGLLTWELTAINGVPVEESELLP